MEVTGQRWEGRPGVGQGAGSEHGHGLPSPPEIKSTVIAKKENIGVWWEGWGGRGKWSSRVSGRSRQRTVI